MPRRVVTARVGKKAVDITVTNVEEWAKIVQQAAERGAPNSAGFTAELRSEGYCYYGGSVQVGKHRLILIPFVN